MGELHYYTARNTLKKERKRVLLNDNDVQAGVYDSLCCKRLFLSITYYSIYKANIHASLIRSFYL